MLIRIVVSLTGSVQFAENVSGKKNAELLQFVDDKALNDDLPKKSSYFDVSPIFYTVKKCWMTILPNDDFPNDVVQWPTVLK